MLVYVLGIVYVLDVHVFSFNPQNHLQRQLLGPSIFYGEEMEVHRSRNLPSWGDGCRIPLKRADSPTMLLVPCLDSYQCVIVIS